MGISSAVHWWEERQLRILVLSSLAVQWLLFILAIRRKYVISDWSIRFLTWLAYLGSDAIAIYALATLFNRQRKQDYTAANNKSILELVWAPILLMHLGGQDCITAYNVEDNELWGRHVLTAVSQITVAIYVFCKSWPWGSHKELLNVSTLVFVPGILKCLEKPWALKKASINSLVSSSHIDLRSTGELISLQDYVTKAKKIVDADGGGDEEDPSSFSTRPIPPGILHPCHLFSDLASSYPDRIVTLQSFWKLDSREAYDSLLLGIYNTFDLLYTKIKMTGDYFKYFLEIKRMNFLLICSMYIRTSAYLLPFIAILLLPSNDTKAYDENDVTVTYTLFGLTALLEYLPLLQQFALLFVRLIRRSRLPDQERMLGTGFISLHARFFSHVRNMLPGMERSPAGTEFISLQARFFGHVKNMLPGMERMHGTQRSPAGVERMPGAVRSAGMEFEKLFQRTLMYIFSLPAKLFGHVRRKLSDMKLSPVMVAQYSLIGFFDRNERHNIIMSIVSCFGCNDLVDQLWCMKPCSSSVEIIELVLEHVKKGWKEEIHDAATYRKFNDRRGQCTLGAFNQQQLCWSIRRPFDESVLLWHIATDVCFYTPSSPHQNAASTSHHGRVAWCDTSPYHETAVRCREISQYMMYLLFVNPEMLLAGTRRNLFTTANAQLEDIFKGQNQSSMEIIDKLKSEEIGIITVLKSAQDSLSQEQGCFLHDALALADALKHSVGDEKKMWEVIQGVWVEMLCYSASRSRGYLHAKGLGSGEEFLTYVWLLLSHMGMETLPEKLQGVEMEENADDAPSGSGSV